MTHTHTCIHSMDP